jgi:hypothetical protein
VRTPGHQAAAEALHCKFGQLAPLAGAALAEADTVLELEAAGLFDTVPDTAAAAVVDIVAVTAVLGVVVVDTVPGTVAEPAAVPQAGLVAEAELGTVPDTAAVPEAVLVPGTVAVPEAGLVAEAEPDTVAEPAAVPEAAMLLVSKLNLWGRSVKKAQCKKGRENRGRIGNYSIKQPQQQQINKKGKE